MRLLGTLMLLSESKMMTVFLEMARSTADLSVPLVAFSCTVAAASARHSRQSAYARCQCQYLKLNKWGVCKQIACIFGREAEVPFISSSCCMSMTTVWGRYADMLRQQACNSCF